MIVMMKRIMNIKISKKKCSCVPVSSVPIICCTDYSVVGKCTVYGQDTGGQNQGGGWHDQGWVYRIENLSNADISDFSVYRRVYCIKPPISSISIFSIPVIFLSFFVKNSPKIQEIRRKFWKPMNQSPQQQQRRKFQKIAENSENWPKIP